MVFDKVRELIAEQFAIDEATVTQETSFTDDLGADSLDIAELTMALEEEFSIPEVPEDELKKILSVGDLVDYISKVVGD